MDGKVWRYDIRLSFAGEQRGYVGQVASAMADSQVQVFCDGFAEEGMRGKELAVCLEGVYYSLSRYCMIFASREYVAKRWPMFERAHAIARQIEDRAATYCRLRWTAPGCPASPRRYSARTPAQSPRRRLQRRSCAGFDRARVRARERAGRRAALSRGTRAGQAQESSRVGSRDALDSLIMD